MVSHRVFIARKLLSTQPVWILEVKGIFELAMANIDSSLATNVGMDGGFDVYMYANRFPHIFSASPNAFSFQIKPPHITI